MSKNSTNSFISLIVGLIIGGILGVLFAPDKGNNTRDRLTFRLNKYKRKLEDLLDEIIDEKDSIDSEAKTQSKKVVNNALLTTFLLCVLASESIESFSSIISSKRSSNFLLYLFNLKVSLSLVLFPLSGANNTPRIPPIINPTIRLINEFVEFLLIIIYLLSIKPFPVLIIFFSFSKFNEITSKRPFINLPLFGEL